VAKMIRVKCSNPACGREFDHDAEPSQDPTRITEARDQTVWVTCPYCNRRTVITLSDLDR
jgi:DNA-directed RNA polymerase subunit RPC12/RpoP